MNLEMLTRSDPAAAAPSPATSLPPEEVKRGLGAAILLARSGCCQSCDFLVAIRAHMALEAGSPAVAAAGQQSH